MLNTEEYKYFVELINVFDGYIETRISQIRLRMYMKFHRLPTELEIHMATMKYDTALKAFLEYVFNEDEDN